MVVEELEKFGGVGRNDPCPCGSGQKFKHCHLPEIKAVERENVLLQRARRSTLDKLQDLINQRRFSADVISAFDLFWDRRYEIDHMPAMDPPLRSLFLDWLLHDYRTSENQKTFPELLLAEEDVELTATEREVTEKRQESFLSVYRVTQLAGAILSLHDVILATNHEVQDVGPADFEEGTLLLTRLLSLNDRQDFGTAAFPMPSGFAGEFTNRVQKLYEAHMETHPWSDWQDFLKRSGYQLNHIRMELTGEEGAPRPSRLVRPDERLPDEQVAHEIAREQEGRVITGTLSDHYDEWLSEPIPAWGNRTPRVLAETPEGREKLELVLEELEEVEERRREGGQPAYDIDNLRSRLGLIAGERETEGGIIVPGSS